MPHPIRCKVVDNKQTERVMERKYLGVLGAKVTHSRAPPRYQKRRMPEYYLYLRTEGPQIRFCSGWQPPVVALEMLLQAVVDEKMKSESKL